MFNLQMDAADIGDGICKELNEELNGLGIEITNFTIESFSYPEEIKKMQEKAAAQAMVGDVNKYQQLAMADALGKGGSGGGMAADMVGLQMGMAMGQQMVNQMQMGANSMNIQQSAPMGQSAGNCTAPKFCPNCGTPTNGANFCSNCGNKLV